MDYKRIYNALMLNAKERIALTEGTYTESHHILPKSMGGKDNPANMVTLTYREHILAHRLLYRIHSNSRKMAYAYYAMVHTNKNEHQKSYRYNSRELEEAKEAIIKARTGTTHSAETIGKMKQSWSKRISDGYEHPNKGKSGLYSVDTIKKMSDAKVGKPRSQETKDKIAATKRKQIAENGHHRTGTKHSEATKEKMRIARAKREERKTF